MAQNDAPRWFSPLKSSPKPHKLAALDCEGNGAHNGFVCAAVVSDKGRYTFTTRQDTLNYIFSSDLRDYWIYSHNLEYDLSTMTGGDLRPYRVVFSGDKILWCELVSSNRHKWRLLDSTNILTGTSIRELGLMVGWAKLDLHPLLQEHVNLGLPLSLLPEFEQGQILSYCLRDADILYLALNEIQEEIMSLGGELRPTVAGIAMDIFRRKFMVKPWPVLDPRLNKLARSAYFGARVEPFRLGRVSGVNGYDVSSLYPSVMATTQFPYPDYLVLDTDPTNLHKIIEREGVTQCTVIVPDNDPPVLPGRLRHHLFFPTGELTQAWPHIELRYALQNGAKIVSADWSLWSSYVFSPFEVFIEKLYRQRRLVASSTKVKEHLLKFLLNSAYGRYGLNSGDGLAELVALESDDQWGGLRGGTLYFLNNWPYVLRPIASDQEPAYANAMIAAYVTAAGRIKMHGHIKENLDRLIYTDTDSLWLQGEMPTSNGLGQFRQVEKERDFWVVAPKEYAVFSGEYLISATVKGVPEAHRLMFLEQGKAEFLSPVGLREGLNRNLTPATWIKRLREKRYNLPKRQIDQLDFSSRDYYRTRPWDWRELEVAFELAAAQGPERLDYLSASIPHLLARVE